MCSTHEEREVVMEYFKGGSGKQHALLLLTVEFYGIDYSSITHIVFYTSALKVTSHYVSSINASVYFLIWDSTSGFLLP